MQMDQNQEVNQRAVDSGLMEQTEQLASERVVSSPLIVRTEYGQATIIYIMSDCWWNS